MPGKVPDSSEFLWFGRSLDTGRRVVLVLCALLLIAVSWSHRELHERYVEEVSGASVPYPGQWLPMFETEAVDGTPVRLQGAESHPVVFAFLSTGCEFTEASLAAWQQLGERFDVRGDARLVGISFEARDAVTAFVDEHGLAFPVAALHHPRWVDLFRASRVPQTVVADPDGRVVLVHEGTLPLGAPVDSIYHAVARLLSAAETERPRPSPSDSAGGGSSTQARGGGG